MNSGPIPLNHSSQEFYFPLNRVIIILNSDAFLLSQCYYYYMAERLSYVQIGNTIYINLF